MAGTFNTRHIQTEREKLVAEIARLQRESQAETDFAAAFTGDENPWDGSVKRLEAAKATLASLDEVERVDRFRNLIKRYRNAHEQLETGDLQAELTEIQQKQAALGGHQLLMLGALHRHGLPVSERDEDERARSRKIKDLDVDRIRIASQLDAITGSLRQMETEYPFLRTYKSYLQAALQKSSAA